MDRAKRNYSTTFTPKAACWWICRTCWPCRAALLSPGAQAVVYVDAGGGHYEPRKIKTGRIGDDLVEVLDGLDAGEKVVTTGSLLIDAETQISQSGN